MEISSSLSDKWQISQRRHCQNSSKIGNVTLKKSLFTTKLNYLFCHSFCCSILSFLSGTNFNIPTPANRTGMHVSLEPVPVLLPELDYSVLSDGTGICLSCLALWSLISKVWEAFLHHRSITWVFCDPISSSSLCSTVGIVPAGITYKLISF